MTRRILIIEDDHISAFALKLELESKGFEVVGHLDRIDDLVDTVNQLKPDIILLDITLNGTIDGIHGAIELRKHSQTRIVFSTALNQSDTLSRIKEISNSSLISKPFQVEQILSEIVR